MKRILSFSIFILFAIAGQAQSIESLRVTHGPWIQNLTQEGVTICWTTNLPAVPAVLITECDNGEEVSVQNSNDGIVDAGSTLHKVRVDGLNPGSTYRYRIQSIEILKYRPYQVWYGDTVRTKPVNIAIPSRDSDEIDFLVFNDIHEKSGFLAQHLRVAGPDQKDFVLYNGDMLDYFEREEQVFNSVIDTSCAYFAGSVPFIWVRGNHETRGLLARSLKAYLDYPENRFYHAFSWGPVRFVILDCGEDKPDDNRYYYGLADYDAYRSAELEWLENEVASPGYKNAPFRVIVIHMPVHPGNGNGYGQKFLAEHFGPVLLEAGADLMLSAHTHRFAWMDSEESGLGFPLLVNHPGDRIEVHADKRNLIVEVKSLAGEVKFQETIESGK